MLPAHPAKNPGLIEPLASDEEIRIRLQWLMFLRVLFTTLLLGATILVTWQEKTSVTEPSLLMLYGIIAGTYILTFVYAALFGRVPLAPYTYLQLILDTVQISAIIYVTGGYFSVFSFLYLVVVTYSSIFVRRRGTLVIAALCSIQYGVMLDLEYFGIITPFHPASSQILMEADWNRVLFKIIMTTMGCFLVAMLASLLSEQERLTKRELKAVREHMKRVEKMAAVGEMSARLAHEIKNPLAALVGSVRMLRLDAPEDSAEVRLMQIILREANRLNTLVTEFLEFSRPVSPNPMKMNVKQVISECVELFKRDTLSKGRIDLQTDYTPGLWIEMDPSHLKQVLWNLLLNAAEATSGAGRVEVVSGTMGDNQVFIRVRDDGSGIPEDVMQQLFDPFFTTKPKGSGLGLSIVYRILESYGFRLDVESVPGIGSTFTIVARRAAPPQA
ncbi:MAG: two-component system sensor histidine kinase NtrB [Desulfatibacillaceae bacterium]